MVLTYLYFRILKFPLMMINHDFFHGIFGGFDGLAKALQRPTPEKFPGSEVQGP